MTSATLPPRLAAEKLKFQKKFLYEGVKFEHGYRDGFDAACELLFKEVIGPMREALEFIKNGKCPSQSLGCKCVKHAAPIALDRTKEWTDAE